MRVWRLLIEWSRLYTEGDEAILLLSLGWPGRRCFDFGLFGGTWYDGFSIRVGIGELSVMWDREIIADYDLDHGTGGGA